MRIGVMTLFLLIVCLYYVAAESTITIDDDLFSEPDCSERNTVWTPCNGLSRCQPTCKRPWWQPCLRACIPGCVCIKHHLRRDNGDICIHHRDC